MRKFLSKYLGLKVIDIARKTHAISMYNELKKTEYRSINFLKELQFERLKLLLIHCQKNVPYYQQLFSENNFSPQKISCPDDIEYLPILTKDDIRKNFEDLKAKNFSQFRPRMKETGGSTGQPLKLYHDDLSHSAMWGNIYRGFSFGEYDLGDLYLTLASGSLLPKKVKFGRELYFVLQNSIIFPSYHLDEDAFEDLYQVLMAKKPKFIYGYSSCLYGFANFLKSKSYPLTGIKSIFTTADMLYPNQREIIEGALNGKVFDNYGCPEAGIMSWECEKHSGHHYNMETCLIQIADENDEGIGRIVSTNLMNYAFPIVRYDSGDIAAVENNGQCECGRSHDKVIHLMGRQRDIITLSDGKMLHGAFFNHLPDFYNNKNIKRFQIVQSKVDLIEVHLDLQGDTSVKDMDYIADNLKNLLDNKADVILIDKNFRESLLSRKHRVVISDVDNQWT